MGQRFHKSLRFYLLLCWSVIVMLLTLISCRPTSEELSLTVAVEIAAGIETTVSARLTSTLPATLTPRATLTLLPTLTDQPTATLEATLTTRPTLTAQPTYTPLPTFTVPPSPTATATNPPLANAGNAQPTSNSLFDVRHLNIIRDYYNAISGIVTVQKIYDPERPWIAIGSDNSLACDEFRDVYAIYQGNIIHVQPAGDANVQSAFDLYQQANNNFMSGAQIWVTLCENASLDGTEVIITYQDTASIYATRDVSLSLIDQAKSLLNIANE